MNRLHVDMVMSSCSWAGVLLLLHSGSKFAAPHQAWHSYHVVFSRFQSLHVNGPFLIIDAEN